MKFTREFAPSWLATLQLLHFFRAKLDIFLLLRSPSREFSRFPRTKINLLESAFGLLGNSRMSKSTATRFGRSLRSRSSLATILLGTAAVESARGKENSDGIPG
ncbi:hypothetical protein BV898_07786 [Hypsibius exemplaris]|uniref:Uncharacterized protein n=1 Tax=Hypsibius exemplaris TaxID=2072580 RepID=A0A1W0WSP5_HYPEX|nr:hypothetical protein BV898_07786 [Hypsibius exemplaris]